MGDGWVTGPLLAKAAGVSPPPSPRVPKKKKNLIEQLTIESFYLLFLIWECQAFDDARKRAVDNLHALEEKGGEPDPDTQRRIFADFQAAVAFAANVAKMLWPVPGTAAKQRRARKRAERLRNLIDIQRDAVLENRKLRNALEHLDEYLDEWARLPRDMVTNMVTSDPKALTFRPEDVFGLYNPKTSTLTVLGYSVNVDHLCNAVWGVSAAASVAMNELQRQRWPSLFPKAPNGPSP